MQPVRLYQHIVNLIKGDIQQGVYKVGDKLLPERDLALQLGVSRTSVREAIIALEVAGLVDVRVGSGVYVKSIVTQSQQVADISVHPLLLPHLSNDTEITPFEVLQARLLLEPFLAELAALNRSEEQLKNIKEAYLMNVRDNLEHSHEHIGDRLFHIRIAEASQNAAYGYFLKYLLGKQYTELFSGLQKLYTPEDMPLRSQMEHYEILSFIQKGDGQGAKKAMQNHIENVIKIFSRMTETNVSE